MDDLFSVFNGTTKKLHEFLEEINQIHPNIKFTMDHTTPETEAKEDHCACERKNSVPFLDTLVSIENNQIKTDLYRNQQTEINTFSQTAAM